MVIGYVVRASCSGTSFYLRFQACIQSLSKSNRIFAKSHKT